MDTNIRLKIAVIQVKGIDIAKLVKKKGKIDTMKIGEKKENVKSNYNFGIPSFLRGDCNE